MGNSIFNSLDASTQGLISDNSLTIASQGLISFIEITDVTGERRFGGSIGNIGDLSVKKDTQKYYKIKVTVLYNGEEYIEEKIVNKFKKPKVEDVKWKLTEGKKILISLIR